MKVLFHRTKYTVWEWGKGVSELEDKTGRPAESVKPSTLLTEIEYNAIYFCFVNNSSFEFRSDSKKVNPVTIGIPFLTTNTAMYYAILKSLKSSSRWQH